MQVPSIFAVHRIGLHWAVFVPDDDPRMPSVRVVAVLTEPDRPPPAVEVPDVPTVLAGMAKRAARAVRAKRRAA
jgi:hypothetical protein